MKRVLSFLLVLLLVAGLVPVQALAADGHAITVIVEGDGYASAPAVANADDIVYINCTNGEFTELKKITGYGPEGEFQIYPNDSYRTEFTMPDGPVEVTVKFGAIGDDDEDDGGSSAAYVVYTYYTSDGTFLDRGMNEAAPGSSYTFVPMDGYTIDRVQAMNAIGTTITPSSGWSYEVPQGGIVASIYLTTTNDPGNNGGEGGNNNSGKYRITTEAENGTVGTYVGGVSVTEVAESVSVNVTTSPEDSYELDTLTVKDANKNDITVTGGYFTMPASHVTITATFKATNNGGDDDNTDPVKYGITTEAVNGTVSTFVNGTAVAEAAADDSVTVTAEPGDGYELTALTVTHNGVSTDIKESKIFTMPAGPVTVTATFEEETPEYSGLTFEYGYDVQRSPTYPKKGGSFTVSGFKGPLDASGAYGTNEGPWTLTGVGTYGSIKNNSNLPSKLSGIVSSLARENGVEPDSMPVHVLTHDGTYITHGVLVMHNSVEDVAFFIGSNWNNGSGYLFCRIQQSGSKTYDVPSDVTDQATPETGKNVKVEHITDPENNSFGADLDMTDEAVLDLLLGEDNITEDTFVFMDVQKLDTAPAVDKQAIEAKASSDKLAAFLDITLWKKVGDLPPVPISNTGDPVTITMTLDTGVVPADAASVYIIYYHENNVSVIDRGVSYNASSRVLTFPASEFSTYALAYKPYVAPTATASAGVLDNVPKTGDSSALLGWTLLILCSAAMLTGVAVIDKKRAR